MTMRTGFIMALVVTGIGGCIDTRTVLASGLIEDESPATVAERARQAFAGRAVSWAQVEHAFALMRQAAAATAAGDPARLDRLVAAASYAIWLARHGEDVAGQSAHADAAIVLCNTAVRDAPERVEGYYYRAVATGLYAGKNALYGPDAMSQIRRDARRAIELDPEFESAGPHRVLGGLYLFAPGPPAGVGSLRRAIRELEAAVRIAPHHAGNLLFLCSAYLQDGRYQAELSGLLNQVPAAIAKGLDPADQVQWRREFSALRARIAAR